MKKVIKYMAFGLATTACIYGFSYIVGFQMARGRADAEQGYSIGGDPKYTVRKSVGRVFFGM